MLRWTNEGVEYEADPPHAEIIECKLVATSGTKEEGRAKEGDTDSMQIERPVDSRKGTMYRAIGPGQTTCRQTVQR